jgi:hypothetical protein
LNNSKGNGTLENGSSNSFIQLGEHTLTLKLKFTLELKSPNLSDVLGLLGLVGLLTQDLFDCREPRDVWALLMPVALQSLMTFKLLQRQLWFWWLCLPHSI